MTDPSRIRLIVCDLDETLLPKGEAAIRKKELQSLHRLHERGIDFLLNSGRHWTFLPRKLLDSLPGEYIGTINGACFMKKDGTVLESHAITREEMDTLTRLSLQYHAGLAFKFPSRVVTYANHALFLQGYCGSDPWRRSLVTDGTERRNYHEQDGLPLGTFLVGAGKALPAYRKALPEMCFTWGAAGGIDVFRRDVNKSLPVSSYLKRKGWSWENVISFGDAGNDAPFVEKSGIGVAMANCRDGLEKSADLIAPPASEDGVSFILDRYFPPS